MKTVPFVNPPDDTIRHLLLRARRIALVGLSPDPTRPSHQVACYLRRHGYTIVPVNPRHPELLGVTAYPTLDAIPGPVDIVDVFRRPDALPTIADAAIGIAAPALWLQEGVIHRGAADAARAAGLLVVMDRCMLVEHARLLGA